MVLMSSAAYKNPVVYFEKTTFVVRKRSARSAFLVENFIFDLHLFEVVFILTDCQGLST